MPNHAVSQADATAHADRFVQPLRKATLLQDIANLFRRSDVFVRQDGGYTSAGVRQLTGITVRGVVLSEEGRNVDADGRIWVRVTANGGNWDWEFFKAKGADPGDLIASDDDVADGAAVAATEENDSGISIDATSAAAVAAIAGDTYSLQCWVGEPAYDRQIHDQSEQEDGALLNAALAFNVQVADSMDAAIKEAVRAGISENADLALLTERLWKISSGLPFLQKTPSNDDGVVTVLITGLFQQLYQNWKDNSSGGGVQKVASTTLSAGSPSYASTNQGVGVLTVGTLAPYLEPGQLTLVCVNDDAPGAPRFRVAFAPSDGTGAKVGAQELTLYKAWDDPEIPIALTLRPTWSKSGDGSNLHLAAVSAIAGVTNLLASNSDDGVLYWKVVAAGGSTFIFKFYKDSSRTQLVAQSPAVAAAAAFTATQQNNSGLTLSYQAGSAPVDATVGSLDIQPFKKGTSELSPDQIDVAITRSALGRLQDAAREYLSYRFNQGSSPTFPDTFVAKGGAFFDGAF